MIVELDLVVKEGARSLWRESGTLRYLAQCAECNTSTPLGHRIDAEDWMDFHECEPL